MADRQRHPRLDGLPYALGMHAIWGAMPLYLVLVHSVPPIEFVAWRVIFHPADLPRAPRRGADSGAKCGKLSRTGARSSPCWFSSAMIGINWVLYVVAIQTDHVFPASLGYSILPLVMMLMGLGRAQGGSSPGSSGARSRWPRSGSGALAAGAISTLLFSLTMAITFGIYGLVRKMVQSARLPG